MAPAASLRCGAFNVSARRQCCSRHPAAGSFAGGNGTKRTPSRFPTPGGAAPVHGVCADLFPIILVQADGQHRCVRYIHLVVNQIDHSGWLPVDATLLDGFDPAGFEIQNLFINRPTTDNVGFFSITNCFLLNLNNFKFVVGKLPGRTTLAR